MYHHHFPSQMVCILVLMFAGVMFPTRTICMKYDGRHAASVMITILWSASFIITSFKYLIVCSSPYHLVGISAGVSSSVRSMCCVVFV